MITIVRSGPRHGFTIVEMVVTIAILGLLAAVLGPRFSGRDAFASRGFHDEAQSVVRYAQKTAIAWRRPVFVCVTATVVSAAAAAIVFNVFMVVSFDILPGTVGNTRGRSWTPSGGRHVTNVRLPAGGRSSPR